MTNYNYQQIEDSLLQLLKILTPCFTEPEKNEVQDFIDHGEYGLALETLVGIVDEENKRISQEALHLIYQLVKMMSFNKSTFEEKLRGHVSEI